MKAKVPCLGIEPAANIAKIAREKESKRLLNFREENRQRPRRAEPSKLILILGNNVFAHAPDTNDFVAGLKTLLKPKGRIAFGIPLRRGFHRTHRVRHDLSRTCLLFYTDCAQTVVRAAWPDHLPRATPADPRRVVAIVRRTYRCARRREVRQTCSPKKRAKASTRSLITKVLPIVLNLKDSLCTARQIEKKENKSIAAYGASAKGSTLLNYYGVGAAIRWTSPPTAAPTKQVASRPARTSRLCTGGNCSRKPDYTLLLTEFCRRNPRTAKVYRDAGGKFIVPIPKVKVV